MASGQRSGTRAKIAWKRSRKGRGVQNDGRSAKAAHEPYASIRADLLASAAYRAMSGNAMRVHLLAEASFHPEKELFLPQQRIADMLKCSAAIEELIEAGFLVKLRDGWRPGRMGGGTKGLAAIYALPDRREGCSPTWKRPGDPAAQGHWRRHSAALRALVAKTTANELKVYLVFHASDHAADGSLEQDAPRTVSTKQAGLARASLHRALGELVRKGLIERVREGTGRRSTTYQLTHAEDKGVRPRRNTSPATQVRHNDG
jgi:hypothetical protein